MFAQFLERSGGGGCAASTRGLLREHFDRAVHADGEDFFDIGDVGIGAVVFDVGAVAANACFDQRAIVGMGADRAGQVQKIKGAVKCQAFSAPSLGQAGAVGFGLRLGRLAALNVGPKRPVRTLIGLPASSMPSTLPSTEPAPSSPLPEIGRV